MDAFYASVEQRDDTDLQGKPVAVGGSRERGVVMAASYEARRFGVRSAMPSATARRLCPDLVFVRPRFDVYKAISAQIREIFEEHTALVEPVALDEAYLDVTENLKGLSSATEVARDIRARILARTGLVASAGVSYNKFLAKVASDHRKPDALFVITPAMGAAFVQALPIGQFRGVGTATEAKMKRLGILIGGDLRARSLEELRATFGGAADYYYAVARGIDERPVRAHRERKSIGAETTFTEDTIDYAELIGRLQPLIDKVWATATAKAVVARTVTLKLKFSDFAQITRARSQSAGVANRAMLAELSANLLREAYPLRRSVRLIGVALSGLRSSAEGDPQQLDLAV
jgi:DNA polymerase-4